MILTRRLIVEALLVPDFRVGVSLWAATVLANDVVVLAAVEGDFAVLELAVPPQPSFLPANVFRLDRDVKCRLGRVVLPG